MSSGQGRAEENESRQRLEAGYTVAQRRWNMVAIIAFAIVAAWILYALWGAAEGVRWAILFAMFLGLLASDFITGMFHWGCDTWGTPKTPILGRIAIRTFREHHIDPKAITRHDWAQTNGENCIFSLPLYLAVWPCWPERGSLWGTLLAGTAFFAISFTAIANQMHKWAHEDAPSWLARMLMKLNLVLTKERHARHHKYPWDNDYCITVGWLNAPLRWIRFWRFAEWIVVKATGAIPRRDDKKFAKTHGHV
jgi:ABC-type phosphate/phosphonate transport system permease subunit